MPLLNDNFHNQMVEEMDLLIRMKDVSCSEREYIRWLEISGGQINAECGAMQDIKRAWHILKARLLKNCNRQSLRFKTAKRIYSFFKLLLKKAWHLVKRVKLVYYAMIRKFRAFNCKAQSLELENAHELYFKTASHPLVSILIAAHNKYNYTFQCLESIQRVCGQPNYEIILVDDCSTDKTANIEHFVHGITVIHNTVNLGFLKNCNLAAKKAKGKYLVLLNNDTIVHKAWLSALTDIMENDPTIGIAGSKLLYPDGTIQEAGGIIWRGALGSNYGRGKPADAYDCNYLKEVDYISGASICIRRELWEILDGFDERYAPAYFEDSDLAFSIRKLGYRVVYQPRSIVTHFERISYATNKNNTFSLLEKNRMKFIEKWEEELENQYEKKHENEFLARERLGGRKRLLMLDDMVPEWDTNAGAKTTKCYLELFHSLGYKIIFVGVNDFCDSKPYSEILENKGIEVFYGHYNREMFINWLDRYAHYFDIVFINRPHVANQYLDEIHKRCTAPIVYYGHDLHYLRMSREYKLNEDKELLKQSKYSYANEINIMHKADVVLSVSHDECALINKALEENKAQYTPIGFYPDKMPNRPPFEQTKGLLFVGGFRHTPNIDAILWFVKEIWPRVKKHYPEITLIVAGSHPTEEILKLSKDERITVTGYLTDEELLDKYLNSRIFIAPLRFGAGVKGKITDALFSGIPIISTSIGLEGLSQIDKIIHPTESVEEWVQCILTMYSDGNLAQKLCLQEQAYVRDFLGKEAALRIFHSIFDNINTMKGAEYIRENNSHS